jgi:hypothetical protein
MIDITKIKKQKRFKDSFDLVTEQNKGYWISLISSLII